MTSEGEERINHHIQNEVVNRINDQAVGVMDVSGQPFKPITSTLGLTSFPCFFYSRVETMKQVRSTYNYGTDVAVYLPAAADY